MDKDIDYIYFLKENNDLIEELKEHETLTFDFLNPFFLVLDYFIDHQMKIEDLSKEEAEDIFSSGFYFLYNAFGLINSSLNDNFDGDIESLIGFDENIYLLLRCDEINTLVEGKNATISGILDQLYSSLEYKTHMKDSAIDMIEEQIDKATSKGDEETISDNFTDIAETLGISIL